MVAEEKAMGRVELEALMLYIRGMGGPIAVVVMLLLRALVPLLMVAQTWFMGYWSMQYEGRLPYEVPALL